MSLKTWIKEFYPEKAEDATTNDLTAINHSIRKWTGALPENLEKHNLKYTNQTVYEPGGLLLFFTGESCALCKRYNYDDCTDTNNVRCPIVRATKHRCDDTLNQDIYQQSEDDPTPMLELLAKTKEFVEQENSHD